MHVRPAPYGRRKLASAPPPEISVALPRDDVAAGADDHPGIRRLIWAYFWLLLLEGALRKWVLPSLANPLLIIRDPIVLLIYFAALSRKVFPINGFVITCFILAIGNSLAALFVGQDNILVTLYGLRTAFLHLPLIFVMPAVLTRADVEKLGNCFLLTAIPMALLALVQFRASPDAWVNVGVGGSIGSQLTVGFGKIRAPGTFSFTSGLALYIGMVAAFLLSFQLKRWQFSGHIVLGAIFSLGIMTAVSGSRTVLASVVMICGAVVYACLRDRSFFGAGLRTALLIVAACSVLLLRHEFRQGIEIHQDRLSTGGGVEAGLVQRTIGGFLDPFYKLGEIPLLGQGIGLGTTAAGGLVYGQRSFVLAEGEWLRVVEESGPILGLIYLAMRVVLVIFLVLRSVRAIEEANPTPLLICAAIAPVVLNGQFGVPTILGFAAFGAGLCLAACNSLPVVGAAAASFPLGETASSNPLRSVRGRSIYAEKLHGR